MRAGTKAVALPQKCPNARGARGASDNRLQVLTRTPREKKGPVGRPQWQRRGPTPQPEAGLAPPHSTAPGWLPVPCMWQSGGGGGLAPSQAWSYSRHRHNRETGGVRRRWQATPPADYQLTDWLPVLGTPSTSGPEGQKEHTERAPGVHRPGRVELSLGPWTGSQRSPVTHTHRPGMKGPFFWSKNP